MRKPRRWPLIEQRCGATWRTDQVENVGLIINGTAPTNTNPQHVQGFLATITAPGDAGATATYSDYAGAHASGIDGIHAEMETEVSSVIGTDVYQHAATVYQTGSGEAGTEALRRRSMSCRASTYIPAASSGQSKGNLFHLAGPNGGAMRGDSVAAVWPTLEVIRDIYSKASQGVVLTWVALWDAKVAFARLPTTRLLQLLIATAAGTSAWQALALSVPPPGHRGEGSRRRRRRGRRYSSKA